MSVCCKLKYQVGTAHSPQYIIIYELLGFTILSTLSYKWHKFRKKNLTYVKCMPVLSLQILSEIFLILQKIKGDIAVKVQTSSHEVPTRYYCQILTKLKCSQKSFEKYSDTKFHENPSSGRRIVPLVWTKRRTLQIEHLYRCTVHFL